LQIDKHEFIMFKLFLFKSSALFIFKIKNFKFYLSNLIKIKEKFINILNIEVIQMTEDAFIKLNLELKIKLNEIT
jgi:hypothetical protein